MPYNGKHSQGKTKPQGKYTKNNPEIKKNAVAISSLLLSACIVISSITIYDLGNSKDTTTQAFSNPNKIVEIVDLNLYEKNMETIYLEYEKANDSIIKGEDYKSSGEILLSFISDHLSKLSETEKIEMIQAFQHYGGEIRSDAIKYVEEQIKSDDDEIEPITVEELEIDSEKNQLVLNDTELMEYIKEYSEKYRIPEPLLIAIASLNYDPTSIDIMGISDGWKNIDSNCTIYSYNEDGTYTELNLLDFCKHKTYDQNRKKNVEYACMVLCQCFKNIGMNGNTLKAIENYFPSDGSQKEKTTQIINIMFEYLNDKQLTFEYPYISTIGEPKSMIQKQQIYSEKYQEYLENLYNEITREIYNNSVIQENTNNHIKRN